MFAKEFYFEEVLDIWDLIFENFDGKEFWMMEIIALSMMVWVRECGKKYLVLGDENEILQRICRYSFKGKAGFIRSVSIKLKKYVKLNQYEYKLNLSELVQ